MKQMSNNEDLLLYLSKIKDEDLFSYNVYQIEGQGRFFIFRNRRVMKIQLWVYLVQQIKRIFK